MVDPTARFNVCSADDDSPARRFDGRFHGTRSSSSSVSVDMVRWVNFNADTPSISEW